MQRAELNTARQSSHKSPARDDDVGGHPSRHFDGRSGVEKSPSSDGTGSITREISRLRVSSKRFPSASYRHASPLEMTMLASTSGHACGVRVHRVQKVQRVQRGRLTALRAEGCGRLSAAGYVPTGETTHYILCVAPLLQNVFAVHRFAQGATALRAEGDGGALRAQIIKKAAPHSRHFDRSEAEWRNLTPQMTEKPAPVPVISTVAERSGEISPL